MANFHIIYLKSEQKIYINYEKISIESFLIVTLLSKMFFDYFEILWYYIFVLVKASGIFN